MDRDAYLARPSPEGDAGAAEALSRRRLVGRRLLVNSGARLVVGSLLLAGPLAGVVLTDLSPGRALILAAAGVLLVTYGVVVLLHAGAGAGDRAPLPDPGRDMEIAERGHVLDIDQRAVEPRAGGQRGRLRLGQARLLRTARLLRPRR